MPHICKYAHKFSWNYAIKVKNTQHFSCQCDAHISLTHAPVSRQHPSALCYSRLVLLSLDLIKIKTILLSDAFFHSVPLSLGVSMPLHESTAPSFPLQTLHYANIYNFLAYLSVGIHSSYTQSFLCTNKPAVNTYRQLLLWAYAFILFG